MSSKFVVGILLPAILVIALAIFLKQNFKPVSSTATPPAASAPAAAAPAQASKASSDDVPLPPASTVAAPTPPPVSRPMTADDIQAEKDRLISLQMNNDPQSLSNILADLDSPVKDIRMAAIDATVQFDDTNAVPILKSKADNAQDLDEKEALLKAADFLALPDVTFSPDSSGVTPAQAQAEQQRQDAADAQRQAQMQQQQQQNQNPPPSSQ